MGPPRLRLPGAGRREADIDGFIDKLVRIFREVRRALADDGTLWLNIGDSYTSGGRAWRDGDRKNPARAMAYRPDTPKGLKPKDLIGIPWRVALALQSDGWYLRADIIWYKPNCQPESVKDRPTRSHEYVFLFSKAERYYYDQKAIMEESNNGRERRNKRPVWAVNTEPFSGCPLRDVPAGTGPRRACWRVPSRGTSSSTRSSGPAPRARSAWPTAAACSGSS